MTQTTDATGTGSVSDIEIRRGRPEDASAIVALILRENHRPADVDEIGGLLASWPSVVATAEGELVGFIYSRRFSPDILEWRNSLVASSLRRGGLGRRLVEAMEAETRAAEYRAVIGVNCWKHHGATRERAAAARAFWLAMDWAILFATDGSAVIAKHL